MRLPALLVLLCLASLAAQDRLAPVGMVDACEAQFRQGGVGLSVAVVKGGRTVFRRGFGTTAVTDGAPVDEHTRFAIGAITKEFTAACAFLLAEDGKLAPSDAVANWYPELTRAADVTLLDLMQHVSGYADYSPLDYVDARMREPIEPDELLRRHAGRDLDFEPGTRWSYSSTNYILLGRIIEKVSGQPFGEFLRARILEPLGMSDTLYEPSGDEDRMARGHVTFALGPPEPGKPEGRGWLGAAGAIWSSADDLAKWLAALMGGRVVSPASLAAMTAARTLADGRFFEYGCGLSLGVIGERRSWGHDGGVEGFRSSSLMIPAQGIAVVVLANIDADASDLSRKLLDLATASAAPPPLRFDVPGPAVIDVIGACFRAMQRGSFVGIPVTEDFGAYLTAERLAGASLRLKPFGTLGKVEVLRYGERGGMEVTIARLAFQDAVLEASLFRRLDGRIAQFFVTKD
ncbi:MAG: beta-lactamase family protein [Planctomycetes bacterium]|nr:beta-lactamase family protein [Planctomycetota bacterium]